MSASAPGGKNPQGNVQSSMGGSKDELAANTPAEKEKLVDGAQMTEQMHCDTQLLLERSGMKDDAAHRLRQPFVREDLQKQAGTLPINDQDISLIPDKSGKIGDGAMPQNGKQGNGKSDDPNRTIKTVETGGGSHTPASSELSNGKPSGFPPPRASTPQNTHGSGTTTAKRDKGSIEDLENRSTKSDCPASRGGSTPSQESTASGGSGSIDERTSQGTSSVAPRRGRWQSRVRETEGGLSSRVFQLKMHTVSANTASRQRPDVTASVLATPAGRARNTKGALALDTAIVDFIQSFRRAYIGEEAVATSKVYTKLAERLGMSDHMVVLDVVASNNIACNLRNYRS